MQPTNLNEYYQSQGLSLPSVQARAATAAQAGIQNYTGSKSQNQQLLAFLTKNPVQNPSAPTLPGATQQAAQPMGAITSASLAPVAPINIPTPPVPTAPAIPQQNLADQIIQQTQVEDTATQKLGQNLSTKIYDLLPKLQGENAALAEANKAAGLDVKKQELQTLNSQILKKQAEISQDDIQLIANMRAEERRDTLLPFAQSGQAKLQGDAQILRALKTSEIGVLNAQVLAKQGDIALAQETAKEAVDAKFAPYKEAINLYKAQLEAIQPLLSADEKKQAREQELRGNLAMKEIDKAQKDENAVTELVVNASGQGAPAGLVAAAGKAKTPREAAQILGKYAGDYLKAELLRAQIAKEYASISKPQTGNTGKPPTQEQIANAGYADRISQANSIIDSKADTFSKLNYATFKLLESNNPIANKLLTPEQRQAAQAMKNFITAKLRKESGAAIAPSEFADARAIYFPSLGDDQKTLSNKKQLRDSVYKNLVLGSGSAYTEANATSSYFNAVNSAVQNVNQSQNNKEASFLMNLGF